MFTPAHPPSTQVLHSAKQYPQPPGNCPKFVPNSLGFPALSPCSSTKSMILQPHTVLSGILALA
jgi:hypothetical protein